uniref:putative reverse transcriptase/maturase n=1 Tax=Glaucosphaera vacuolata TaxID=38265 RepID=UPI001FCD1548|nr:putative reverse transcriptase/maturase [Glaucosphaera vacuolata]UNJ18636.1 putative reverse transcriptase/maturase [Glaucosphaera vacuolata]
MICSKEGAGFTSPLNNGLNTNGIPKEITTSVLYFGLRRNNRTQGSTNPKESHSGELPHLVDGGFILPDQRPVSGAGSGRDLGNASKTESDESVLDSLPDDLFYNPSEDFVSTTIERWKNIERKSKGIAVPRRFTKLVAFCNRNKECTVNDIYSILYSQDIYDLAYREIKLNTPNMTLDSDGTTLDRWNAELVNKIIDSLKNESFQFTPARVIEIPKQVRSIGKLKVTPFKDKIVQRILAWILEAIYDPTFAKESFGFRSNMGCHDALRHIKLKYNSTRWFIEGDILKCFDEIDHNILIGILRRRIKDEKFVRLIAKALKAGYLNQWKVPQNCLIGTPQGSIVSPILCNIFMHEFDQFMLKEVAPRFQRGKSGKQTVLYKKLVARSTYFSNQYKKTKNPSDLQEAIEAQKQLQSMPSVQSNDPNFRRFQYCRYADDWLVGFAGPYKEALEIRDLAKDFLSSIKLRLNMEKTLITNAAVGCIFLGVHIHIPQNQQRYPTQAFKLKQLTTLGVRLNAPLLGVFNKLSQAGYCSPNGFKALPRFALYACEKDKLVKHYNSVLLGILNYYSTCDNYRRLSNSIYHTLRSSCCKLIAARYKLKTVRAVLIKYGKNLQNFSKTPLLNPKDNSLNSSPFKLNGDSEPRLINLFRNASYTSTLRNKECVTGNSTYNVHMHHVRMIKDVKEENLIARAMQARRGKQIPLCSPRHNKKHKQLNSIRRSAPNAS